MLIAGDDGRVLWRLGGKHSDYIMEDELHFSRQHRARYITHSRERDVISFLDNASDEQDKDFQKPTHKHSRGLAVELLRPKGQPQRARILKQYKRPDRRLADRRGSMRLPNNNVLMTWTDAGYLSEHTDDDKVLMEARFLNETRLATYRVYKSTNWVGTPKQPPDIKAIGYGIGANSMTAIYVSWNGATEHNIKLFSGDKFIGQTNRTGFETVFVTDFHAITVRAAAYDVNGKFLGRSNDVPVEYANGWVPEPTDLLHTEPLQLSEDVGNMIPGPFDQSAPIDDVGLPDIQIPPVNAIQPSDPASGVGNKIADLPTPTVQYTKPTTPNQMPTMSPTSVRSEKWI